MDIDDDTEERRDIGRARLDGPGGPGEVAPGPSASAAWQWELLGRSVRWGAGASAGVFMIGAAGACCGAVPLGLVLAAAGAAGLAASGAAVLLALASAVAVAVVALARRRRNPAGSACLAPSSRIGEPSRTFSDVRQKAGDLSSTVL